MVDTGWVSPGTIVNDSAVGTVAWNNPSNVSTSDNSYALASTGGSETTNYLKATNFGFSIPTGSTIDGIEARVEKKRGSGGSVTNDSVKIVKSDGSIGTESKSNGNWSTTEAYSVYGSSTDLWTETWSYIDINDVDFGVVLSAALTGLMGSGEAFVDHIQIKVYYTEVIPTASVSPITTTLSTPSVTPTWVFQATASVSPVSSTLSVVDPTATYVYEQIASVSPLTASLSLPNVLATYIAVLNADISPIELSLVLPTVSATYKEYIADVSPISTSFSIPEVTPILVFSGFVSPLTISVYLSEVSATYRNDWKTFGAIETAWATTSDPSTTWGAGSTLETAWNNNLYNTNTIILYDQDIAYDTAFITYDGYYILSNNTWTNTSALETTWADA